MKELSFKELLHRHDNLVSLQVYVHVRHDFKALYRLRLLERLANLYTIIETRYQNKK